MSTPPSEIQSPRKHRYRDDPTAARITLTATRRGVSCPVDAGRAIAETGLHPAACGDGSQPGSGDIRATLAVDKETVESIRSAPPLHTTVTGGAAG